MSNSLVAFFSETGTTMDVANRLARTTDSDLFAIVPSDPYTSADLDWRDKQSRSTLEAADPSCRPTIASRVEHIEDYDTIFLGFPIWWYVAPAIINTFLESYDLSGKTIVLFATSGGSGMGKTASVLKACAPDAKNRRRRHSQQRKRCRTQELRSKVPLTQQSKTNERREDHD